MCLPVCAQWVRACHGHPTRSRLVFAQKACVESSLMTASPNPHEKWWDLQACKFWDKSLTAYIFIHLFDERLFAAHSLGEPTECSRHMFLMAEAGMADRLLREYDVRRAEEGEYADADLPPELAAEEADADREAFAAFSAATASAQSQASHSMHPCNFIMSACSDALA